MRRLALALALTWGSVAAADPAASPESVALASNMPGQVRPDDPHWDLEVLYFESKMEEGLVVARAQLAANPDDVDLYWHVARFLFETGETVDRTDTRVDKLALYREMIEVSEAGLARFPDHPHLLFARGIAYGRFGTTKGVLKSLSLLRQVESDWSRAASSDYVYNAIDGGECLPCDAQLTLGIFYRIVPESWVVKLLSGSRGDLDKSLAALQAANQCSPGDIGILKELGVTQLCMHDRRNDESALAAGRQALERALRVPARGDSTDIVDHRHIRMLLDDPSLACAYSRDGQQELDDEAVRDLESEH